MGISRFFPQEGRSGETPAYFNRTLRVNTPDSQPYSLVDTYQWMLTHCSRARGPHPRPSWYQVCNNQGNPVPVALQVSLRETEELVAPAGRDLAVISELDWLMLGASHLLGQMAATPALLPFMSSITLLQCYALETCRSVEMLEQSSTARYANHIWWLRDGHLCLNSMALFLSRPGSLSDGTTPGQTSVPRGNSGYC